MHRPNDGPRWPRAALACLLCLWAAAALPQQEVPPGAARQAPPPRAVEPIPAFDIPQRAESALSRLRAIRDQLGVENQVQAVSQELPSLAATVDELRDASRLADIRALNMNSLDGLRITWSGLADRLARWQALLRARAQTLQTQRAEVAQLREPWAQTLEQREDAQLPTALVERAREVLGRVDATAGELGDRLDRVLTLQDGVTQQAIAVDEVLSRIDAAQQALRERLLVSTDSAPLWQVLGATTEGTEEVAGQLRSGWQENLASVTRFVADNRERVIAQGMLFGVLVLLLALLKRRRRPPTGEPETEHIDVLSYPVASALLLALLTSPLIYPELPLAVQDALGLLFVFPVFVLLRRVVHPSVRVAVFGVFLLYVVDQGGGLVFTGRLPARILLLVNTLLGLGLAVWALRPAGWLSRRTQDTWARAVRTGLGLAGLVLLVALLANVYGAVYLARMLTNGALIATYLGLGLYATALVLQGLAERLLRSRLTGPFQGLRRHPELARHWVGRLIRLTMVLLWGYWTLDVFRVRTPVFDGVVAALSHTFTIGTLDVSLGDILAFVVALWVGVMASRFIRFVLSEDVFTRVRLPRGVPSTINLMVNYGILTLAFFVALAAAGIELGKFAIVAGALGVGIGFGLQNVVNNFVSGLILAFERPVQAGDFVEVGPLAGRMSRIGMRSSTLRTYAGAEVIVPNANLISNELINWTLSDSNRRIEVNVGVSYGSAPRQVMDVCLAVARSHPEVMQEPEPFVVFVGFGASSLDFSMKAWTQRFEDGLRIQTELYLGVWDALAEAGIEIPFPQQDLHLKTVTPGFARGFGLAVPESGGETPPTSPDTPSPAGDDSTAGDTSPIRSGG